MIDRDDLSAETAAPDGGDELLAARERVSTGPRDRARVVEAALGILFVAGALAALVLLPGLRPLEPGLAYALTVMYALAWRVEFEVGPGWTNPAGLLLVPMLFLLPVDAVPLFVCAGLVLSRLLDAAVGRRRLTSVLLAPGQALHALGPAVVLALAGVEAPALGSAGWLVLALAAVFAVDAAASLLAERVGLGIPVRAQLRPALAVYAIDALLAPVGLLVAFAARDRPWTLVLLLPLGALFWLFARERSRRFDHVIELGRAYRRTAMLLGDVVEADDAYTGAHSRDVVEVSLAVADRLGVPPARRRLVEFGALLHDVGKLAVPKEIINKPGPLTDEEWVVMRRHTIEGQRMLEAVGGLLGEVGQIVRASHERWDGAGYPDGLAGEAIPLEARICACCDAWNAMTTDRPYRRALDPSMAAAELRRGAGAQFDPQVVRALIAVVAEQAPPPAPAADRDPAAALTA